jgi:hypothetical protein
MSEPLSGMAVLKQVTNPEWLKQPEGDFSIFRKHPALDARWDSGKPRVVCYDKNAMYLGAAASAKLGVGPFAHVEKPEFEDRAGLWRIFLHETPAELAHLPPIAPEGFSWQYTPVLRYLHHSGYKFDVEEAYLFSEQHAVLRRFYEKMRHLRAQDKTAAKELYTRTFGVLAHQPPEHWRNVIYRPDWFFGLVAEAKARMYIQVQQFYAKDGVLPVAIKVDSLYFDQEVPSIPLGSGIGQYKIKQVSEVESVP